MRYLGDHTKRDLVAPNGSFGDRTKREFLGGRTKQEFTWWSHKTRVHFVIAPNESLLGGRTKRDFTWCSHQTRLHLVIVPNESSLGDRTKREFTWWLHQTLSWLQLFLWREFQRELTWRMFVRPAYSKFKVNHGALSDQTNRYCIWKFEALVIYNECGGATFPKGGAAYPHL